MDPLIEADALCSGFLPFLVLFPSIGLPGITCMDQSLSHSVCTNHCVVLMLRSLVHRPPGTTYAVFSEQVCSQGECISSAWWICYWDAWIPGVQLCGISCSLLLPADHPSPGLGEARSSPGLEAAPWRSRERHHLGASGQLVVWVKSCLGLWPTVLWPAPKEWTVCL